MAGLGHAEKDTMKNLTRVAVAFAIVIGLIALAPTNSGAAADPTDVWSEPSGGPFIIDGTGEEAEQGDVVGLTAFPETFTSQAIGDVVTIVGAGNGHGVGMSQYGSQGRAIDGQTYDQILAAYYQGTDLATDPNTDPLWVNLEIELVKVYLKAEENVADGAPVDVVRDDTTAPGGVLEAAILMPGDTLVVEYLDRNGPIVEPIENPRRCSFSTFAAGDDPATATPTFASVEGSCVIDLAWDGWSTDPTARIVIDKRWEAGTPPETGLDCVHSISPTTLDCAYSRGEMHIRPDDYDEPEPHDTGFHIVQELSIDDYARGIGEMPYSWNSEALKTQAVAARSYARYMQQVYRAPPIDRQWCWCSIYDTSVDQVYLGWGFDDVANPDFGFYAARWVSAAADTAGQVLLNSTQYVSANYSASNGGASENNHDIWGSAQLPYLQSIPDPLDLNDANWARSWTREVPIDYFAAKVGLDTVGSTEIVSTYESGSPSDIAVAGKKNGIATTKHYTATQFMALFSGTEYRLYAPRILSVVVPPPPGPNVEVDRLWGSDRYATAVAVSQDDYQTGTDRVFIATGENFPDALAVAPLAHQLGGPLLLTRTGDLPAATAAEVQRLGASQIYILGGTAAVSTSVAQALASYGTVTRIWGSDRYATAVEISKVAFPTIANVAYVGVGTNFPDALAGAPVAADREGPLLLTQSNSLNGHTRRELQRLKPDTIVVLGGGTSVGQAVVNELGSLAPNVISLAGADRYATAVKVSQHGFPSGAATVYVARGSTYPDALSGGPAAANAPGPILLVPDTYLPSLVASELVRLSPDRVVILGGTAAVSSAVESAINALFD